MKTPTFLLAAIVAALSAAPAFADPDADARAALALALATNKRTAELEKRVTALEARTAPRTTLVPTQAPVVAAVPFAITPVTGPVTTVLPAAGVSTSRSVGFQAGFTRTVAAPTVLYGGTTTGSYYLPTGGGCANGQCGAPEGNGYLFAPFGGRFRR